MRELAGIAALAMLASGAMAGAPLSTLAGSEWRLARLGAEPVNDAEAWIAFKSDGRAIGSSGCNNFAGSYTEGGAFSLGPLAATRKACLGPAMSLETQFFTALSSARASTATHLVLELFDENGAHLATFSRADWD